MTEPAASARIPFARRLFSNPWLWAVLCLTAAVLVLLATDDLGFPAFLLMLVGGWLCGFGFVNATFRMPAPTGVIVHVIGGVGAGALLALLVSGMNGVSEALPSGVRAGLLVVQLAAVPAAGWIWLGLLGRVTSAIGRRDAAKAPVRAVPEWERDGDESVLRFAAIPMRMRALTTAIVGVVVVVGVIVVWVLIATDDLAERLGARIVIIAIGVLFALPAYAILQRWLRRGTVEAVLALSSRRLRLEAASTRLDVPLDEIDRLLWCTGGDYARVEVRAGQAEITLNAGFAKVPPGVAPGLPELPRHVRRRLELFGFAARRTQRGVVIYER